MDWIPEIEGDGRKHGSTIYLWNRQEIGNAVHYVVNEQGEPMSLWRASDQSPDRKGGGTPTEKDRPIVG